MGNFPANQMPEGPYVMRTARTRTEKAWHSDKNNAFLFDILATPGFDTLYEGMIMARNKSAAGRGGSWVPYAPLSLYTNLNLMANVGRTFAVADVAPAATTISIPLAQAPRFAVGDDVVLEDDQGLLEELGAITGIVLGTVSAVITVTTASTAGAVVTEKANIRVRTRVDETDATEVIELCVLGAGIESGTNAYGIEPQIPASGAMGNAAFKLWAMFNYEAATLPYLGNGARVHDGFLVMS